MKLYVGIFFIDNKYFDVLGMEMGLIHWFFLHMRDRLC